MKANHLLGLAVVALMGMTSCEKDLYEPDQDKGEKKVTDLVIPDNFDWKMTQNSTCTISSDHAVLLSVYNDEACKNLLATVPFATAGSVELPLWTLKGADKVYVQYENNKGERKVEAATIQADGNISFTAPKDSKAPTTRAEGDFTEGAGKLIYPSSNGGTIMFEDNYPYMGDYDFNDFVGKYMLTIYTKPDLSITKIVFDLSVQAIGGIDHYVPCLRLPIPKESIKSATLEDMSLPLGVTDPTLSLDYAMQANSNYVVFKLHGAEENANKNKDSKFLNTERDKAGKDITTPIKTVTLTVTFKEKQEPITEYLTGKDFFDFFLIGNIGNKGKEIHMLGFSPVVNEDGTLGGNCFGHPDNNTYKTKKTNFVWGINIPQPIGHATEKTNFLQAYPQFDRWVEKIGVVERTADWYNHPDANYIFKMQ